MLGFQNPIPVEWDAAFINDGPLDWISRNSSKPGRPDPESWVLHAGPEWSTDHVDSEKETVTEELIEEWERILDQSVRARINYRSAHRWLYARSDSNRTVQSVFDPEANFALAGDWLAGDRIEGAFISGRSAAARIINSSPEPKRYEQETLFD
jgi:hypothetical protein